MSLDYRPDWPPTLGLFQTASGVQPDKFGQYRNSFCATAITAFTTALGAACTGARIVRKADGTPFYFLGTGIDLYEQNGGSLTNVSKAAGTYTAGEDWWFCQYGDETLACNFNSTTQTRSGGTGTAFADHATAPKAKIIIAQSGHVLALNYNDGSSVPNGIKWASQGSSASWTTTASNTAGNATLVESPGEITAGAEIHDIVVVWKRYSMYIGKRIGGAGTAIWQFNMLSPKIGCPNKEAWVSTPVGIIFASTSSGIYKFDGSTPVSIDDGVRSEIYKNFAVPVTVYLSHDEAAGCVHFWVGPLSSYCYNYISRKWSKSYDGSIDLALSASMIRPVRDSNYDDYANLGGSSNTARRCHLIVASDKKSYNLSGSTPANGLAGSFAMQNVRHPKAGPREETIIERVSPVWSYSIEQSYSEPSSGTLSHLAKIRQSSGTTSTGSVAMDSMMGFDILRTANTHYLSFAFGGTYVLADLGIDMDLAGKR